MRMLPRAAVAVTLALASAAVVAGCGGEDYPDPPAGWATFSAEGISFRHPPGWRAERPARQPGASRMLVRLAPAGSNPDVQGPRAELRLLQGPDAPDLARRASANLVLGKETNRTSFDHEVPGARTTTTSDVESGEESEPRYRVSSVYAATAEGLVVLDVRARTRGEPDEARTMAGSLRLKP